jgi:mitochondrial fission protein ELM1
LRPVHWGTHSFAGIRDIVAREGRSRRFDTFHAALRSNGVTRPFDGRLDHWHYIPIRETPRVAEIVQARLGERGIAI